MYIFISYLFTYYHVTPSFPSSLCLRRHCYVISQGTRSLCFNLHCHINSYTSSLFYSHLFTAMLFPSLQCYFDLCSPLPCYFPQFNFASISPFHCHIFPTVQVSSALASPLPCHFLQPQVLLLRHLYCHVIASGASLFYWARENALLLIALELSFVWVA